MSRKAISTILLIIWAITVPFLGLVISKFVSSYGKPDLAFIFEASQFDMLGVILSGIISSILLLGLFIYLEKPITRKVATFIVIWGLIGLSINGAIAYFLNCGCLIWFLLPR